MIDAQIIICTRVESRRLPHKAFLQLEGRSVIEHILKRVEPSGLGVILAIPSTDVRFYEYLCSPKKGIRLTQGNNDSPLHRMAYASSLWPTKWIVRITHDDILIDCQEMLRLLQECEGQNASYGYSQGIVEGAGVEVIRADVLRKAALTRKEPTEFISYFVKGDSPLALPARTGIRRSYRLTLDYLQDAIALKIILRALGPDATAEAACRLIDSKPYILDVNKLPDVSFYTCAKDMEKWVHDTMLSVLRTDTPNMEYIIVDDGSKDDTLLEIAKFLNEKRISLIVNDESKGLASASNQAIAEARGKIVVRVDADDLLVSGMFKEMWPFLRSRILDQQDDIVYPAYKTIDEDGTVIDERVLPDKTHHAGCAVMRKGWLNEMRFKEGLRHWDGLELYQRAKACASISYFEREALWQYRKRRGSLSELPAREALKPNG